MGILVMGDSRSCRIYSLHGGSGGSGDMKVKFAAFIGWMTVWMLGNFFFDRCLQLTGSWLMMGGAVTFALCEAFSDGIKRA